MMKKMIYIAIGLMCFGFASAQIDPQTPESVMVKPQPDSATTNKQILEAPDLKTMDAVKTQDHPKPVIKDTVQVAERKPKTTRKARNK